LVAAGDQGGLSAAFGITFKCLGGNSCRDDIKVRVEQVLANLGSNAQGAQLTKFTTTVAGTLPIVAWWNNRYKYTINGQDHYAKYVAIDLAPKLSGKPAYAYIQDDTGTPYWYTIPDDTANLLLTDMYNLPAPAATIDPNATAGTGGTTVYGSQFYATALYNGTLLTTLQFVASPAP
jgi:hypothetical protein